jgi:WD40 repeat protein
MIQRYGQYVFRHTTDSRTSIQNFNNTFGKPDQNQYSMNDILLTGDALRRTKSSTASRRRRVSVLVATSHPSGSSTNGALTLLCPQSGTVQSSTRIQGGDLHQNDSSKGQMGVNTISRFPHRKGDVSSSSSVALAYGASPTDPKDSYGMLVSLRGSTAPPIVHWKCRLPEPILSGGLLVSPVTSRHVVGGGSSGTLYVWDVLQGGVLVRAIPSAHYRAIACMKWSTMDTDSVASPWDALLCTGGADGMVHAFSHIDLVEHSTSSATNGNVKLPPVRSWTKHHLAVTALVAWSAGRLASASEDGQVIVMELCSGATLAALQLPDAIRALTVDARHGRRLFAGSVKGTIHIIDMDAFAVHQTVQMGVNVIPLPRPMPAALSIEEQVFGTDSGLATEGEKRGSASYQTELSGHDRSITSLLVFDADDDEFGAGATECLVSGDESGVIRIWDSRRGCCVRVVYPWGSQLLAMTVGSNPTSLTHPVTQLCLLRDDESNPLDTLSHREKDAAGFGMPNTATEKRKRLHNFASMVAPLQKFANTMDGTGVAVLVPFLEARTNERFWDLSADEEVLQRAFEKFRKQRRKSESTTTPATTDGTNNSVDAETERQRLQQELDEAKATIARWELVNNKLLQKLQTHE